MKSLLKKLSLAFGGLVAALLASTCCIAPLISIVGIFGISASQITFLASIKAYLVTVSLALIALSLSCSNQLAESACCNFDEKSDHKTNLKFKLVRSRSFLLVTAMVTLIVLVWPYVSQAKLLTVKENENKISFSKKISEKKTSFILKGMKQTCCIQMVEYALREVDGFLRMTADVKTQRVEVWFDPSITTDSVIQSALGNTPYEATPAK